MNDFFYISGLMRITVFPKGPDFQVILAYPISYPFPDIMSPKYINEVEQNI